MEMFINLLTYFLIYSFLGWCIESVFKSFCEKKLVNSGFLYGPFCPIYGYGAIIMYIFLDDVRSKPFITFCLGFVVLSIWEYAVGVFLEKVFHRKYWDYSKNKFNLQGRVCLLNSIFWGVLGVLFIDIIHPFVTSLLSNISYTTIIYCDICLVVAIAIDTIVSISNNFSIATQLKRVEELNNSIKEKIEEIKNKGKNVEKSLQDTLEELKNKRAKIIRKSYRQIVRLKRAFPSLKSEEFTKFLSDKKDFFKKT
ncbi:MAG: hypothetical protein IKF17_00110 [Clostridia bacterium]|nr:hypothetical protein [Clostridia bacterium]